MGVCGCVSSSLVLVVTCECAYVISYTLDLKVTDTGGLVDTMTITVHIVDVNEPPTIEDATREIKENSPHDTPVGISIPASYVSLVRSRVGHARLTPHATATPTSVSR